MPHNQENPVLANFYNHITPNIWPLYSSDYNPLYCVSGATELKTVERQRWTEGKDNNNLNKRIAKKPWTFWSRLKALVEANNDSFKCI